MNVSRTVATPALESEDHGLGSAFPKQRARPHRATRFLSGPLGPADMPVSTLEAAVTSVALVTLASQRHRVGQAAFLQQEQGVAAVKGAVERNSADFQALCRDLIEQSLDNLVRLRVGLHRTQSDGIAAMFVQQHGGGVTEKPFGPLLLGPANDVGAALAVVSDIVSVDGEQPTPPPILMREMHHII